MLHYKAQKRHKKTKKKAKMEALKPIAIAFCRAYLLLLLFVCLSPSKASLELFV